MNYVSLGVVFGGVIFPWSILFILSHVSVFSDCWHYLYWMKRPSFQTLRTRLCDINLCALIVEGSTRLLVLYMSMGHLTQNTNRGYLPAMIRGFCLLLDVACNVTCQISSLLCDMMFEIEHYQFTLTLKTPRPFVLLSRNIFAFSNV